MNACSPDFSIESLLADLPAEFRRELAGITDRAKLEQALAKIIEKDSAELARRAQAGKDVSQSLPAAPFSIELLSEDERQQLQQGLLEESGKSILETTLENANRIVDYLQKTGNEKTREIAEHYQELLQQHGTVIRAFGSQDALGGTETFQTAKKKFLETTERLYGLYGDQWSQQLKKLIQDDSSLAPAVNLLLPLLHEPEAFNPRSKLVNELTALVQRLGTNPEAAKQEVTDFVFAFYTRPRDRSSSSIFTAGKFNLEELLDQGRAGAKYKQEKNQTFEVIDTGDNDLGIKGFWIKSLVGNVAPRFKKPASMLAAIPNFFGFLQNERHGETFFAALKKAFEAKGLSEDEIHKARLGIEDFQKFRKEVNRVIHTKILPDEKQLFEGKKPLDVRMFEEPVQLLRNLATDNRLDANVVGAIAVELVNLVGMGGSSLRFNDDTAIAKILGVNSLVGVSKEPIQQLRHAGLLRRSLVWDTGNKIWNHLNLKFDETQIDGFQAERMIMSLGEVALALGHELGLLEDGLRIPTETFNEWKKGSSGSSQENPDQDEAQVPSDEGMTVFVRLKRVSETDITPAPQVQKARDIFQDAKRAFDVWFNSDTESKTYRTTPIKEPNRSVKRTPMETGDSRAKGLEVMNNQKFVINRDFQDLLHKLQWRTPEGERELKSMLGWQEPADVHVSRRDSQAGINLDIERRVEALKELYDANPEELYLEQRLFANLRAMVVSNTIDNQNSKSLHRWAIGIEGTEMSVNPTDPEFAGSRQEEAVMLSIGLGVGVGIDDTLRHDRGKFGDPDYVKGSLTKTQDFLDEHKNAIGIIKEHLDSPVPYSLEERQTVLKAVEDGGEKGHTLLALDAYARLQKARETGQPYQHTLVLEVDGKTNGAAFAFLQILPPGESSKGRHNQVGLFYPEDGVTDYASKKASKSNFKDIYQGTKDSTVAVLENRRNGVEFVEALKRIKASYDAFGGVFEGDPVKQLKGLFQRAVHARRMNQFLSNFVSNMPEDERTKLEGDQSVLVRNLFKDPAMQVAIYRAGKDAAKRTVAFGSSRLNVQDWTYNQILRLANPVDEQQSLDTTLQNIATFLSEYVTPVVADYNVNAQEYYDFLQEALVNEGSQDLKDFFDSVILKQKTKKGKIAWGARNPQEFVTSAFFAWNAENKKKMGMHFKLPEIITKEQVVEYIKKANNGVEPTEENISKLILNFSLDTISDGLENFYNERVGESLGQAVFDGIQESFQELIKIRESFLNGAVYQNNIYTRLFEGRKNQRIEEKGSALSQKEEDEIKAELRALGLYPSVAHAGTGRDARGNPNFGEMLDLTKEGYVNLDDKATALEKRFALASLKFQEGQKINTGKVKTNSLSHTSFRKRPLLDIGVKAFVVAIHAMDGAWISRILQKYPEVVHIFDAMLIPPQITDEVTQYANEAFIKLNAEYSVMEAMDERIRHVNNVITQNQELQDILLEGVSVEQGDNVDSVIYKIYAHPAYQRGEEPSVLLEQPPKTEYLLDTFDENVKNAGIGRELALQKLQYVNQAMLPDASYSVTPADRASFPKKHISRQDLQRGSSEQRINRNQVEELWSSPLTAVTAQTIRNKIDEVESVPISAEHRARLNEVWDTYVIPGLNMVDSLIETRIGRTKGGVNLGEFLAQGENREVLIAAAENAASSPIPLSLHEIAAHEFLHAIFVAFFEDPANFAYREAAERLYERAREVVKPEHFLPEGAATEAEMAAAQRRWNHIFANPNGALDEFIAMARTNEQLIKILNNTTLGWDTGEKKTRFLENPWRFVWELVANALAWLSKEKVRVQRGGTVSENLDKLLRDILTIQQNQQESFLDKVDRVAINASTKANEATRKAVYVGARELSRALSKVNKKFKGSGQQAAKPFTIAVNDLEMEKFKEYSAIPFEFISGFMADLSGNRYFERFDNLKKEVMGLASGDLGWRDLLLRSKKDIDQARKSIKENTIESLESFFDSENPPTVEERRLMTDVLLKTDISALLEQGYSLKDVSQLLKSEEALQGALSRTKREIEQQFQRDASFWIQNQAKGLGHFMVQGLVVQRGQLTNAHDIVQQYTLEPEDRVDMGNEALAEALTDRLATLEALALMPPESRQKALAVIQREEAKAEGENGIEVLLAFHSAFKKKSLEDNFSGRKTGTHKGYTKEHFNPNVRVDVQVDSPKQEEIMRRKGFKKVKRLARDNLHAGAPLALYISRVGHARLNAGVISLTGEQYKGTSLLDGLNATAESFQNKGLAKRKVRSITKATAQEARRMLRGKVEPNLDRPYLLPVLDQFTGKVINQRYVMSTENKDALLERDDRVFEVLGSMFASIHDKKATPDLNKLVLNRLAEDWEKYRHEKHGMEGNPKYTWRLLSATSSNSRDRELWRMLPDSTKLEAERLFGKNPTIPIRKDLVNYLFGNRDVTITEGFKALNKVLPEGLVMPESVLTGIRMADQAWREVIQIVRIRESIVVPGVVVGNMISNVMLLLADGVPPGYIIQNIGTAIVSMRKYQLARAELAKLDGEILAQEGRGKDTRQLEARRAFLESSMGKNPVHGLVEEGLFPAIVEDINISGLNRNTTYIGQAADWIQQKAKLIGPGEQIIAVGRELSMLPGSKFFQLATAANQYGDFVARYIQYNYNTQHRKMEKNEAVHTALTDFVFYDEMTDPAFKFLNDYGMLMFSKFFLRIQRVYAKLLFENPASVASFKLIEAMGMNLDSVWIGDYFLNYEKLINRFDLLPYDNLLEATGLPGLDWFVPSNYMP